MLSAPKKKLQNHWSTHFYEHVFSQIDEEIFADLYHEGFSRPNKPVNGLISLEIIKHLLDLSDEELEHACLFDFRVRNALGKEALGDNIYPKTFTNFRRRLLDYEEETGRDPLHEVFEDHRSYLMREFDIDATAQRMDSTFIEANIKQLTRLDLLGKVVHNFLTALPDALLQELPDGIEEFAEVDNLELSFDVTPEEARPMMETLAEYAAWLVDRFEDEDTYTDLESFAHLQRVLDEQCYRIPELEADQEEWADDDADDDDDDSPGWEPIRSVASNREDTEQDADDGEAQEAQRHAGLEDPDEIDSGSLQNPHDEEATYRSKHGEKHYGYKANLAETCGDENPFRLITTVRVDTNNTDDGELLDADIEELAMETRLLDLLVDGGYTHQEVEAHCRAFGIIQHFTGITGTPPPDGTLSLADFDWDGHELLACPAGHEPLDQSQSQKGRLSFRMAKNHCEGCEYNENCYVEEKQQFDSYGFWDRKLEIAKRRARLDDPASQEFLNQRAGAESMINEVFHKTGKRTKFTGRIKVKNASIATAIGTNLKRVSRHLNEEAEPSRAAA